MLLACRTWPLCQAVGIALCGADPAALQGVADRVQTLETVRLTDMDARIERAGNALVSQA